MVFAVKAMLRTGAASVSRARSRACRAAVGLPALVCISDSTAASQGRDRATRLVPELLSGTVQVVQRGGEPVAPRRG